VSRTYLCGEKKKLMVNILKVGKKFFFFRLKAEEHKKEEKN
jgi:hypothetical protein